MNVFSRISRQLLVLKLFCYIQIVGALFLILLLIISGGLTYLTWIIVLVALFFMVGQWFNAAHILMYSSIEYLFLKKKTINIYMILTLNLFGWLIFYKGQKFFEINEQKNSKQIVTPYSYIPKLYWVFISINIVTIVFAFSYIWWILYNKYSKQKIYEVANSWLYITKLINPLFPLS